jgi:arylsulfatase A-like enzyme
VLDGTDISPLLRGNTASFRRDALYWHFPGYLGAGANQWRTTPVSAIRRGEWKLLEFLEDGRLELYNVVADAGQANNLAAAKPDLAKELHAKLQAWRTEIKAPMPAKRDSIAPATEPKGQGKGKGGGGKKAKK